MRLCAKGTDIVTDVWLAENYWKICLSQSFFKEDLHLKGVLMF